MTYRINVLQDLYRYKKTKGYELSEPSLYYLILFRLLSFCKGKIMLLPLVVVLMPIYMFLSLLFGIYIPRSSNVGPGLRIHHYGGIVINPCSIIGKNCTIRHGVTIGNQKYTDDCPIIGDNVEIGTGAKVLGRIRIGNNVKIGANAVVVKDIPDNCIVGGIPATIIRELNPDIGLWGKD